LLMSLLRIREAIDSDIAFCPASSSLEDEHALSSPTVNAAHT
jgi:hypothetical protein